MKERVTPNLMFTNIPGFARCTTRLQSLNRPYVCPCSCCKRRYLAAGGSRFIGTNVSTVFEQPKTHSEKMRRPYFSLACFQRFHWLETGPFSSPSRVFLRSCRCTEKSRFSTRKIESYAKSSDLKMSSDAAESHIHLGNHPVSGTLQRSRILRASNATTNGI